MGGSAGEKGEWEQGEGQTKGMSGVCECRGICRTLLPFFHLPANGEGRQVPGEFSRG